MSFNNRKLRRAAVIYCRELRQNQTPAETILWEEVRNRKFRGLKFTRQYPIFSDYLGKDTFYIADFYCYNKRLGIELDGKSHLYQKEKDELRTEDINQLGIKVLRFKNEEVVRDINKVLKTIKKYIETN